MTTAAVSPKLGEYLGDEAESLLTYQAKVDKSHLQLPGPDFIDRVWMQSDRNPQVLRNLQSFFDHGRLGGTGYMSLLPVDQGIEHSGGASFAKNPLYFDGENIIRLAIEGGCNGVATTFGVFGTVARKYAHKIPSLVKINHNELVTYPNTFDQIMFGTVQEAWNLGAAAVGATVYYGSENADRQIQEVAEAFAYAHELGMACVLSVKMPVPWLRKTRVGGAGIPPACMLATTRSRSASPSRSQSAPPRLDQLSIGSAAASTWRLPCPSLRRSRLEFPSWSATASRSPSPSTSPRRSLLKKPPPGRESGRGGAKLPPPVFSSTAIPFVV